MSQLQSMTCRPLAACGLSALLLGCAAAPQRDAGAAAARTQALIVRTVADWPAAAPFGRRAAEVAGVQVREVAIVAPRQFAISLLCDDAAACQAAVRRLQAEPAFLLDVLPDQRRRLPARPGYP